MGFDINLEQLVCKYDGYLKVEGISGWYYGEMDIKTKLPHGRGFFYTEKMQAWSYLGYF